MAETALNKNLEFKQNSLALIIVLVRGQLYVEKQVSSSLEIQKTSWAWQFPICKNFFDEPGGDIHKCDFFIFTLSKIARFSELTEPIFSK